MAQAIPASNTAEGVLALLAEDDDALKVYALKQINASVHQFWHQASGSIATIEALFEDEEFSHRELAALVASKAWRPIGCFCWWFGGGGSHRDAGAHVVTSLGGLTTAQRP